MKEITDEPFGYYFNGRFYKTLYELRGRTMSEHSQPIPLYQHPKVEITEEEIEDKLAAFYLTAKRPLHKAAAKAILSKLKGE